MSEKTSERAVALRGSGLPFQDPLIFSLLTQRSPHRLTEGLELGNLNWQIKSIFSFSQFSLIHHLYNAPINVNPINRGWARGSADKGEDLTKK